MEIISEAVLNRLAVQAGYPSFEEMTRQLKVEERAILESERRDAEAVREAARLEGLRDKDERILSSYPDRICCSLDGHKILKLKDGMNSFRCSCGQPLPTVVEGLRNLADQLGPFGDLDARVRGSSCGGRASIPLIIGVAVCASCKRECRFVIQPMIV